MTRPTLTRTLAILALVAVLGWLLTLNWWLFGTAIVLGSLTCIALGAFDEPDDVQHSPEPDNSPVVIHRISKDFLDEGRRAMEENEMLAAMTREQRRKTHMALGQMRRRAERVRSGDGF